MTPQNYYARRTTWRRQTVDVALLLELVRAERKYGSIAEFAGEMGDAVPQALWDFSLYGCSCRGDGTGRSG